MASCNTLDDAANKDAILLKNCPDYLVTNKMPCVCSTDQCPECENPPRTYYILDGNRRGITEFDQEWVQQNCDVKEEVVYLVRIFTTN